MVNLKINEQGLIESKNEHAVIMGTASNTVNLAPFNDYTADFLALAWRQDQRRADILFDCHRFEYTRCGVPANYFENLANKNVPVYLQEKHPQVPNSHRIPIELLTNKFSEYFACSISYMLAIAIMSGYKTISIYGVDLRDDTEYSYQRPNLEYLIGWACGMGIKVIIPTEAWLLKATHRYGYDREPDYGSLSEDFLQSKMNKYINIHEEHSKHAIAADGARQAIVDIMNSFKQAKKGKLIND